MQLATLSHIGCLPLCSGNRYLDAVLSTSNRPSPVLKR